MKLLLFMIYYILHWQEIFRQLYILYNFSQSFIKLKKITFYCRKKMQSQQPHIDQYLLSGQLATWGFETQYQLMSMRVLVLGITGLGAEVAKNLVMMSCAEVCLCDDALVTAQDVARNPFLKQSHIGKFTRAEASLEVLKKLNPNCRVRHSNNKSPQYISTSFDCVVVIDQYDKPYLTKLNLACRQEKVHFVMGGCLGLYGFAFVDFSQTFTVHDAQCQEPKPLFIEHISKEQNGLVTLHSSHHNRNHLKDGDIVEFSEVKGMTDLNGRQFGIKLLSNNHQTVNFTIGDTRHEDYQDGGIVTKVKLPRQIKFKSLEESLAQPYGCGQSSMLHTGFDINDLPEQLHLTLKAVYDFYSIYKRLPRLLNQEDAREVLEFVKKSKVEGMKSTQDGCESFNIENIDQRIVLNTARYAQTQISPVCTFWGGIIAQQVVKSTGSYIPLKQWLHHQFFSSLPQEQNLPKNFDPNDRYSDYIALFGHEFVQKCQLSSPLIVGAGSAGNEFLKMFAMMGVSTEGDATTYIVDDGKVKLHHLTSHALLRKQHIGSMKCEIACKEVKQINEKVNSKPIPYTMDDTIEQVLDDDLWDSIDFIVSATDNVRSKNYIDNQCVWHQKPCFEVSTKGIACTSQIILPHKTLTYKDVQNQPEYLFDRSSLVNFTYLIDHAIQWAKELFQNYFEQQGKLMMMAYRNLQAALAKLEAEGSSHKMRKLQFLKMFITANQIKSYEYCVEMTLEIFNRNFDLYIAQLLHAFPSDHVTHNQSLFWSGLKRCPEIIHFDPSNDLHLQFVIFGANIYARMFDIEVPHDLAEIISLIQSVYQKMPQVQYAFKNYGQDRQQQQKRWAEEEFKQKQLIDELKSFQLDPQQTPTFTLQFDLNDPSNEQLEFLFAAANLRAKNYRLGQTTRFNIRKTLRNVNPKVITSSCVVVGATGIEIIKCMLNKPIESFRNIVANLALPMVSFFQPLPAKINRDVEFDPVMVGPVKVAPEEFTKWSKLDVHTPLLLCDLIEQIKQTYGLDVTMIAYKSLILYSIWQKNDKTRRRQVMTIEDIVCEFEKKQLFKWKKTIRLDLGCQKDGEDYIVPDVRYHFGGRR